MEYFSWRKHYRVKSFFSVPNTCEFCDTVKKYTAAGNKTKVYWDMKKWFKNDSECLSKYVVVRINEYIYNVYVCLIKGRSP